VRLTRYSAFSKNNLLTTILISLNILSLNWLVIVCVADALDFVRFYLDSLDDSLETVNGFGFRRFSGSFERGTQMPSSVVSGCNFHVCFFFSINKL
jgi:hypothetical protein